MLTPRPTRYEITFIMSYLMGLTFLSRTLGVGCFKHQRPSLFNWATIRSKWLYYFLKEHVDSM